MVIRHNIPTDKQQDVINCMDYVEQFLPNPPKKHLVYLFEVYNNFIAKSYAHEDITCSACRSKVISQIRFLVTEWKKQQSTLEK